MLGSGGTERGIQGREGPRDCKEEAQGSPLRGTGLHWNLTEARGLRGYVQSGAEGQLHGGWEGAGEGAYLY